MSHYDTLPHKVLKGPLTAQKYWHATVMPFEVFAAADAPEQSHIYSFSLETAKNLTDDPSGHSYFGYEDILDTCVACSYSRYIKLLQQCNFRMGTTIIVGAPCWTRKSHSYLDYCRLQFFCDVLPLIWALPQECHTWAAFLTFKRPCINTDESLHIGVTVNPVRGVLMIRMYTVTQFCIPWPSDKFSKTLFQHSPFPSHKFQASPRLFRSAIYDNH